MIHADVRAQLVSGGDDRLSLDARSGLNIYGYDAAPRPFDIDMGSSTASAISEHGFDAARRHHARLVDAIRAEGAATVHRAEIDVIRDRIRAALGSRGQAPDVDIITAPSGTDVHLLAALLMVPEGRSLLTITSEGSETGSAVGTACAGRHFMRHPPSGVEVLQGAALDIAHANIALAVRDAAGELRDETEIEAQLDATIADALAEGKDCLLVVTDVSKTGLIAPGLETVLRLRARHGARLGIMIDACQLRISPATIRAYLEQGFPVAITGSKFLGGPIFSGALLIPGMLAERLRGRALPDAIGDYFSAADFPAGWAMRAALPERADMGVLLRWHAALLEWDRLLAIPPAEVERITRAFALTVDHRLRRDPAFERVATRALERRPLGLGRQDIQAYDRFPTIFPFLLAKRDPAGHAIGLLNSDETRAVHQRLASGDGVARVVRLGQPVALGTRSGMQVAALRLCLGARWIVEAASSGAGLNSVLADAMTALDRAASAAADISASADTLTAVKSSRWLPSHAGVKWVADMKSFARRSLGNGQPASRLEVSYPILGYKSQTDGKNGQSLAVTHPE
jgi:hypothetical protein